MVFDHNGSARAGIEQRLCFYASNNVKIPGIRVPAGQASGFRVMDVFA